MVTDLALHWEYQNRQILTAFLLLAVVLVGFGIGFMPNAVDNFAHIGGFVMGLLWGVLLYPAIM